MDPSNSQQQHHQQQQGMETHTTTLEDVLNCSTPSSKQQQEHQKKLMNKPQPEEALNCPRCDSSNTKFCYYNNYSLTQPRYFCKACRRYWTKGGSLRNVPVGGGCRKNNKRISSCSSSSTTSKAKSSSSPSSSHHHQDNNPNQIYLNTNSIINNPLLAFPSYDTNDLTLAFGRLHKQQPTTTRQLGFDHHEVSNYGRFLNSSNTNHPGFIDALRNGFLDPSSEFHNFYSSYGNGIGMGGDQQQQQQQQVESNNNGDCHEEDDQCRYEEMGLTSRTSSTKQEVLKDGETKVLWNFPIWHGQFGGGGEQGNNHHHDHNNMGSVIDHSASGRVWNGFNGSSWHGLVNSPLM